MLTVKTRPAEKHDLSHIVEFNFQLAWESEQIRLNRARLCAGVERVLSGQAEAEYLMAEHEANPVGQLMLTREWSDWRNGWFYWIQSVYVAEPYRRQGVFRQLLEHARTEIYGRQDAVGLRLYVEEHNHHALETYQRLGFHTSGYRVLELLLKPGLTD